VQSKKIDRAKSAKFFGYIFLASFASLRESLFA
jgi:hypothetical protein